MNACRDAGVDVVVARGSAAHDNGFVRVPPGFVDLLVEDQRSPEAILGALHRSGLRGRRFATVQTSWEYSLVTAGTVAAALGARAWNGSLGNPCTKPLFRLRPLSAAGCGALA